MEEQLAHRAKLVVLGGRYALLDIESIVHLFLGCLEGRGRGRGRPRVGVCKLDDRLPHLASAVSVERF